MATFQRKKFYKVIIIGDMGVGKTSLLDRYVNKKFSQSYKATIGADCLHKEVETAGQERFQSLGNSFYKGSNACVLVYDVTSTKTFESLERWRNTFLEQVDAEDDQSGLYFVVIGNKCDLPEKNVELEQVEEWAGQKGDIPCFEASAKEGTGVEEAFRVIAKHAAEHIVEEDFRPDEIDLEGAPPPRRNCLCQ